MKILELVIDVVTKADNAISELSRVEKGFDKTSIKAGRFDNAMLGVGTTATAVGDKIVGLSAGLVKFSALSAVAFAGGATFLNGASKQASDLEESINAVNVVFGEGADTILDFGKNSARAVGLSTSEFNQLATETGALLSRTGKPMEEVAELTNQAAKRAADLASVFNTDVNLALSAINQAIRGETEAIRKYAADVTDASIASYLLSEGINTKVSELSQEEKQLLRLQLIMKQTAKVEGDFLNTIDSAANRAKVNAAEYKDFAATIGTQVLPIKVELLNVVGKLLYSFNSLSDPTKKLISQFVLFSVALLGLFAILAPVLFVVGKMITVFGLLATAIGVAGAAAKGGGMISFLSFFRKNKSVIKIIRGMAKAMTVLRGAMLLLLGPVGWVIAAVVAVGLVLQDLWTFFKGGNSVIGGIIEKIKELKIIDTIKDSFKSAGEVIKKVIDAMYDVFDGLGKSVLVIVDNIIDKWKSMIDFIVNNPVADFFGDVADFGGQVVDGALDLGKNVIKNVSQTGSEFVSSITGNSPEKITKANQATQSNTDRSIQTGDLNFVIKSSGNPSEDGLRAARSFKSSLDKINTNTAHASLAGEF